MATIRIVDLTLRTIIGTHPWERTNKQDLIVNITLSYDASKASQSDHLKDALDYEAVATKISKLVEGSRFLLLEKLSAKVLDLVMSDKRVVSATVRLDKPHALSQAKCVSFEISAQK